MQKQIVKKSKELNKLVDDLYDIFATSSQKKDFKQILKKISFSFYENEYLGVETYVNDGAGVFAHSRKIKKPVYLVVCSRWNYYMLMVDDLGSIRKTFENEIGKLQNKVKITNALKSINALDASILAYLAMAPMPLKNTSILTYLKGQSLQLAKCIIGVKGKYPKKISNSAKLYKDWAFYKQKAHPTRKNLDLSNLNILK